MPFAVSPNAGIIITTSVVHHVTCPKMRRSRNTNTDLLAIILPFANLVILYSIKEKTWKFDVRFAVCNRDMSFQSMELVSRTTRKYTLGYGSCFSGRVLPSTGIVTTSLVHNLAGPGTRRSRSTKLASLHFTCSENYLAV